jgi:O-antigen/teichoic acid export membrane protein
MPGLWVLLGAVPLILLRQAIRRFAIANLHVRAAIALDIVVAVAQLGGFVVLGYFGSLSLAGIFAVMGVACGLACVGVYLIDPPTVRFVRGRFLPDWNLNWAFGKWALRTYLVGQTPTALLWILGLAAGAAAAGVFGACLTLIGMSNVLLLGVSNVLTPQASHAFATGGVPVLRRMLHRTAIAMMVPLGAFCLFIMLSGDWLMVLSFGSSGQGTGAILAVLALHTLIGSVSLAAGCGLWAIDQPRANFLADASAMAVTLVAAFLILPFGVLGAALANLAGMVAGTVLRTMTLSNYLHRAAAEGIDPPPRLAACSKAVSSPAAPAGIPCVEPGPCLVDAFEAVV